MAGILQTPPTGPVKNTIALVAVAAKLKGEGVDPTVVLQWLTVIVQLITTLGPLVDQIAVQIKALIDGGVTADQASVAAA